MYAGCLHKGCVGSGRKGWRAFQDNFGRLNTASGDEAAAPAQTAGSSATLPGLTDLGNAKRLVQRFGQEIKYVPSWSKWLSYNGKRWELDETGRIMRLAEEAVADIFGEAASENDAERSRKLYKHAVKSESSRSLHAMVSLASSEPGYDRTYP